MIPTNTFPSLSYACSSDNARKNVCQVFSIPDGFGVARKINILFAPLPHIMSKYATLPDIVSLSRL